jgi:alkylation response protein AidB-like acyl-CoA dehydrogenase
LGLELRDDRLSSEQLEFRDTLRHFFEGQAPMTRVRQQIEAEVGVSRELWKRACDEFGIAGLAIDERFGGQGFGLAELAIAVGEVGRSLAPLPISSVAGLTARVVAAAVGDSQTDAWLEALAGGTIASLAWIDPSEGLGSSSATTFGGDSDRGAVSDRAFARISVDAGDRLSGEAGFVLDADVAEWFFVLGRSSARTRDGDATLYAVEASAPGVSSERLETLDLTRRFFRVRFDAAPSRVVGDRAAAVPGLRRALDEATALSCAEMVGGMECVLETAVDYAAERVQFGRAIGSFQAIKHKAADMLIDFESARTATGAAIDALDSDDPDAAMWVAVAKAHTGPAYVRMATESIQIQGGVGYTWEYDAHLYFRRAQASAQWLGEAGMHEEALAVRLAHAVEESRTP